MVNGHGGAATDAAEGKDQSDRIADATDQSSPGRGGNIRAHAGPSDRGNKRDRSSQ